MVSRALEVVHVGAACRDVASDDARGWRLGGGVTYAALATARLGLRTAAVVGVDAVARSARELDTLRDAGVDLLLVDLDEGPVGSRQRSRSADRCRPSRSRTRGGWPRAGRWSRSPGRSATTG
jgi:sugar/nucleoside kinase (ribokinase family)